MKDIINSANKRRDSKAVRTRESVQNKERYFTSDLRVKYRRICDLREQTGVGAAVFDDPRNILTENERLGLSLIGTTSATGVQGAVRVQHPNLVNQYRQDPVPPARRTLSFAEADAAVRASILADDSDSGRVLRERMGMPSRPVRAVAAAAASAGAPPQEEDDDSSSSSDSDNDSTPAVKRPKTPGAKMPEKKTKQPARRPITLEEVNNILLEPPVVFLPQAQNDNENQEDAVPENEDPSAEVSPSTCLNTAPKARSRTSSLSPAASSSSLPSIIPPTQNVQMREQSNGVRTSPDIFQQSHISVSSASTTSSTKELFLLPQRKGILKKRKIVGNGNCTPANSGSRTSALPTPPPIHKKARLSLPKPVPIPMTETRRDDLLQVQANLSAGLRTLTVIIQQLVAHVAVIAEYFKRKNEEEKKQKNVDDDNAPTE